MNSTEKNKGFTLIEVVLALSVMAAGLFILMNAWAGTYSRLQKTNVQVQMAALLERKVTEIEREYRGKPLDSIPEEKEDSFGIDKYSWKMESKNLQIPDLTSSLVSRDEGANQNLLTIMKMFTDHLSKSIKEVKITVYYADRKKPLSANVTIYMMDYDRPLPVPGMGG